MYNHLLTQATKNFWSDLGKSLVKTAATTVVSEVVRSNIDIWKQMRLKRKRRAIDLIYREEDDAYKERREARKKAREEAEQKRKQEAEQKAKPEPEPSKKKKHKSSKKKSIPDSPKSASKPDEPKPSEDAPAEPAAPKDHPSEDSENDTDGSIT